MQLLDRRSAIEGIARRQADQSAAQPGSALAELALNPGAKGPFVDAGGLLLGELLERRVDDGFDGPLAQNLRAKGMDGSDGGFFQMFESVFDVRSFGGSYRELRARSSSWRRRSFSSPAALLVNVTATM